MDTKPKGSPNKDSGTEQDVNSVTQETAPPETVHRVEQLAKVETACGSIKDMQNTLKNAAKTFAEEARPMMEAIANKIGVSLSRSTSTTPPDSLDTQRNTSNSPDPRNPNDPRAGTG